MQMTSGKNGSEVEEKVFAAAKAAQFQSLRLLSVVLDC